MRKQSRLSPASFSSLQKGKRSLTRQKYVLRLYVAGTTALSQRAIINIKKICEEYLKGRYDLEIVDVYLAPMKAKENDVIAVPVLIKLVPIPRRMILGDLSNELKVLAGLGVKQKDQQ